MSRKKTWGFTVRDDAAAARKPAIVAFKSTQERATMTLNAEDIDMKLHSELKRTNTFNPATPEDFDSLLASLQRPGIAR